MPAYTAPFAAAGAAAGGGFLGGLGRMLEPLDYGRQALWNMPRKLAEGDIGAALPGLLGLGTGALAATGVGTPLAMLLGTLAGGTAQGIGKAADDERFAAPTGDDALKALGGDPDSGGGMVGSMLLSALGDPLTMSGFVGGHRAGANFGKGLEELATARGPQFPGGVEKLGVGLPSLEPMGSVPERAKGILQSPHLKEILGEIPTGHRPLGAGIDAIGTGTPGGIAGDASGVVRIGGGPGSIDTMRMDMHYPLGASGPGVDIPTAPSPRPDLPEMLQPARSRAIGPYRVEHVPRANMGADPLASQSAQDQLINQLEGRGYQATQNPMGLLHGGGDLHAGNLGMTPEGRFAVTDPGAVLSGDKPVLPGNVNVVPEATGGRIKNWLLDRLGASESVQAEIEAELAKQSSAGRGILLPKEPLSLPRSPSVEPGTVNLRRPIAAPSPGLEGFGSESSSGLSADRRAFAGRGDGLGGSSGARALDEIDAMMGSHFGESSGVQFQPRSGGAPEAEMSLSALQRELLGGGSAHPPTSSEVNRVLRRQLEVPAENTMLQPHAGGFQVGDAGSHLPAQIPDPAATVHQRWAGPADRLPITESEVNRARSAAGESGGSSLDRLYDEHGRRPFTQAEIDRYNADLVRQELGGLSQSEMGRMLHPGFTDSELGRPLGGSPAPQSSLHDLADLEARAVSGQAPHGMSGSEWDNIVGRAQIGGNNPNRSELMRFLEQERGSAIPPNESALHPQGMSEMGLSRGPVELPGGPGRNFQQPVTQIPANMPEGQKALLAQLQAMGGSMPLHLPNPENIRNLMEMLKQLRMRPPV